MECESGFTRWIIDVSHSLDMERNEVECESGVT